MFRVRDANYSNFLISTRYQRLQGEMVERGSPQFPRRSIRNGLQYLLGFIVANDSLASRLPVQRPTELVRDVGEMARRN